MQYLFVLNDAGYGSERSYNGLRLAMNLGKRDSAEVRIFLLGDAVSCALENQQTPDGYYNLGRMLRAAGRKSEIACCGTCMDARGIGDDMLVQPARRSTLDELTDWTEWAGKVMVF